MLGLHDPAADLHMYTPAKASSFGVCTRCTLHSHSFSANRQEVQAT